MDETRCDMGCPCGIDAPFGLCRCGAAGTGRDHLGTDAMDNRASAAGAEARVDYPMYPGRLILGMIIYYRAGEEKKSHGKKN